jgi:hypothetical protein
MSFETDFDSALTIILGKATGAFSAIQPSTPPPVTTPTTVTSSYSAIFLFGGGGSALSTSADPILIEVPDSGDLQWVHLYATNALGVGVNATATLSIVIGSVGSVPSAAMNGSGSAPSMTAQSYASTSISGWTTHVNAGDAIRARITAISGGATALSLILRIRRDGN